MNEELEALTDKVEQLNQIGIALSSEKDTPQLLEKILLGAQKITNADAGTLYMVRDDKLHFEILRNDTLKLALGGTSANTVDFPPVPLHHEDGTPNNSNVVTYCVLHDETINIEDAYTEQGFDFSGTRTFDEHSGYRSKSMLTVPMKNHLGEIIGVLQLLNDRHWKTGEIKRFSDRNQQLVESLASQAAVALTNKNLIEELEILLDSFIKLVAAAIDEKSPYTGGHCRRVPELTMMLAEAANDSSDGPLKNFCMDEEDHRELSVAAWLHDCGKIATPEYIVDKATKLETIFDRIQLVDARFELLRKQAEIDLLKGNIDQQSYEAKLKQYEEEQAFIQAANIGGEFMDESKQQRVRDIAGHSIQLSNGESQPLLNENEIYNLTICKGTLTDEEREVINNHIVVTIKMLESLPFPKHLKRVPEYAGGHHERMDGKGYPNGLTREQMSWQARMMAIADIFEALTAADRPYKKAKTLTESLFILGKMKEDNHVDPDLFDLFIRNKVYQQYAEKFLAPEQIDEVDHGKIPGFNA